MAEDIFEKMKNIDKTVLTHVVRQDQRSPSFEISAWSVRPLSSQGVMNPFGLWLFSGQGSDSLGERAWSVVLKLFFRPEQATAPDDFWYWKRELLLAQSGLTEQMPGPVKAPRYYHSEETPEGAWVWMELVQGRQSSVWSLDAYRFAANQLGQWNGAYLTGTLLPHEPWMTLAHYRSWLGWMDYERDWQFPLNKNHLSSEVRKQFDQLWNERGEFYAVLERLPKVFSHFDSQRRNAFIRRNEDQNDELVLVDWALCGLGPLGAELTPLVAISGMLLELPAVDLAELDTAVFLAYLQGLREAGWSGDVDVARLGHVAWVAVFCGCIFPGWTAWWCAFENRAEAIRIYGIAEEELFWNLLPILAYSLSCASEARLLMKKLRN